MRIYLRWCSPHTFARFWHMATPAAQENKRWTYEEYYRLDDEKRYELIDGKLLMVPGPDMSHQDWLGNLYLIMRTFVQQRRLGRVLLAPFDVILNAENVVQPDLIFVAKANLRILQHRGIFGTPDLLVELVSSYGVRRDRYDKRELYARFG